MMTSNFFSREDILKRQGRTARARRNAESSQSTLFASTSLRGKPLNIIVEEDESRMSSRSPSPMLNYSTQTTGLKASRRHANVSDIRIVRDMPVHDENDLSPLHDNLLSVPRPAPRPPTENSSPDSFKLLLAGESLKFPHPPTSPTSILGYYGCESPTHSMSSLSSSPCSRTGMPLTPSSSDDESSMPSRIINPRRVSIHPLVITKRSQRIYDELSISPNALEIEVKETPAQPDGSYDSDADSDSEWYTREFSKILTLRSPLPPSFPHQNSSRPDSMPISANDISPPPSAKTRRRLSKALPPTPCSPPPSHLEPRRTSKIPNYPPPPVPTISRSSTCFATRSNASPSPSSSCSQNALRRPPPRFSVPADLSFDQDEGDDADDSSSAFSFSMYEIDLGDEDFERPQSPRSAYSQPSFEHDDAFSDQDVTFDMDYSMMLPLSLPSTPMDLEADIAIGLEQLRNSDNEDSDTGGKEFVFEDKEIVDNAAKQAREIQQPAVVDDVFSPISPPLSSSFLAYYSSDSSPTQSPLPAQNHIYNDERVLKSKWSISTLGSVRDEDERRGASSMLRLYFGGQPSATKHSSHARSRSNSKVPATPTSPFGAFMSPRKASKGYASPLAASPSPRSSHTARAAHSRGASDVIVIGYGNNGAGLRRQGSMSTISDAGTEVSSSSTSSSGLRRKPIPVEMFLRSAA